MTAGQECILNRQVLRKRITTGQHGQAEHDLSELRIAACDRAAEPRSIIEIVSKQKAQEKRL